MLGAEFVGSKSHGGPLAEFLPERRGRALDLYLLLRAVAGPAGGPVALPSVVWARALGLDDLSSPEATVSRTWTWLEQARLVETARHGRLRSVRPLADDASGGSFVSPQTTAGRWFSIPFAYFDGNYHNRIGLAAKCVLVVALAHRGQFTFVSGPPATWHGLSRDSIKRGIRVLSALGLLVGETRRIPDALTAAGFRMERRYEVAQPFVARD